MTTWKTNEIFSFIMEGRINEYLKRVFRNRDSSPPDVWIPHQATAAPHKHLLLSICIHRGDALGYQTIVTLPGVDYVIATTAPTIHHIDCNGMNCLTEHWIIRQYCCRVCGTTWSDEHRAIAFAMIDAGIPLQMRCANWASVEPPTFLVAHAQRYQRWRRKLQLACTVILRAVRPRDVAIMLAKAVWAKLHFHSTLFTNGTLDE